MDFQVSSLCLSNGLVFSFIEFSESVQPSIIYENVELFIGNVADAYGTFDVVFRCSSTLSPTVKPTLYVSPIDDSVLH